MPLPQNPGTQSPATATPADPSKIPQREVELAKVLQASMNLDAATALVYARHMYATQDMLQPHPPAPIAPTPVNPAALTPEHLEDANYSAWQQYSQLLDNAQKIQAPKDAGMGAAAGKRRF